MLLQKDELLKTFKKYNKTPREVQLECFDKLLPQWDKYKVHVISAPVATGKSLILRAIQEQTDAAILTSDNGLVDQYRETFPDINILKGKARYKCQFGDTCETTYSEVKEYCSGCPYMEGRCRAEFGEQTVFNPMSYIVNIRAGNIEPARVLLIDEAHKLTGFLRMLGTVELKQKDATFSDEDLENPTKIQAYIKRARGRLERLVETKQAKGENSSEDAEMLQKLRLIEFALTTNANDYICYVKKNVFRGKEYKSLCVEAIRPPKAFTDILMQSSKIVLTSGTMFPHHVKDLVGERPYSFTELPSPIPPEKRLVVIPSFATELNAETPPEVYAQKLEIILKRHAGQKGIIHTTYGLAESLKPLLKDKVLFHSKETKKDSLEAFKQAQGGAWLVASGMAEGIDLAHDLARVNVVTKLQYPNLGDEYVKRRLQMKDGKLWYLATTLEHLVQASGRTTRSADDFSITYVLDVRIHRLIADLRQLLKDENNLRQYLPNYFLEALRF